MTERRIPTSPVAVFAMACLLAGLGGCGSRDSVERVFFRSVDWARAAESGDDTAVTAEWPHYTRGLDRRFVVQRPPTIAEKWIKKIRVDKNGQVRFSAHAKIGDVGQKVVFAARNRLDADTEWRVLPSRVESIQARGNGSSKVVSSFIDAGSGNAGKTLQFEVAGYVESEQLYQVDISPHLRLPPHARLEFAAAVIAADDALELVEYAVQVCPNETGDAGCEEVVLGNAKPDPWSSPWTDLFFDLSPWAGREVQLRVVSRDGAAETKAEAKSFIPVIANPIVYGRESSERRPSVLLISLDTLRADHLGCYGYRRETSPYIDSAFAGAGTVFESSYSAATTTLSSHMTMMTGVRPCVHGMTASSISLNPNVDILAEHMRDADYATIAFTENAWVGAEFGFARGMDRYVEDKALEKDSSEAGVRQTFDRAIAWLRRHAGTEFFMFLHTYEIHHPYDPPDEYSDLYRSDPDDEAFSKRSLSKWAPVLYDREIRFVDDQLRRLDAELERLGIADDTIVIITSDHGDEFLDHDNLGHGRHLYDDVLRVPLIVRGPGVPRGRRIDTPVGSIDLMSTILSLSNVNVPGTTAGRDLSLLWGNTSDDEPGEAVDWVERPLFAETHSPYGLDANGRLVRVEPFSYSVRLGRWSAMRYREKDGWRIELYDDSNDPGQQENLSPDPPALAADAIALLEGYEASCSRGVRRLATLNRSTRQKAPEQVPIDPERAEKLRALGYLR